MSDDAATRNYVDNAIADVHIPDDLSCFTNSPGYLVSNDISNYCYLKSELSTANDISDALSSKADLSSLSSFYNKSETSNSTEIDVALDNKRDLSDFNVYVDPMADMTTTKFTVVGSYAGDPSTPLFTVELTHSGGEESTWSWRSSGTGTNQRISIAYSSSSYTLFYFNIQDGGGNEHTGEMALPIAAPYWTGEVQDDWFHFSVTSQNTIVAT